MSNEDWYQLAQAFNDYLSLSAAEPASPEGFRAWLEAKHPAMHATMTELALRVFIKKHRGQGRGTI
jgi:hypothetical protein